MPKEAGSTRRVKKAKDPNKPKRALSAYMFFANEHRETIKEENPGLSFGEIGKKLGETWKSMDDDSKKPFNDKAALDKERYAREMKNYKK
ncbi:Non-histone chromosomal protein 6 [Syncephalis plumigaleata]|nr:Non-histone chromosomal protein 6 [Syncephalis plumigaleata]